MQMIRTWKRKEQKRKHEIRKKKNYVQIFRLEKKWQIQRVLDIENHK